MSPHELGPEALAPGAPLPPGYRHFSHTRALENAKCDAAAHALLTWEVQRRAGLRVTASESPLRLGTTVEMRLGPGPASLRIPCRVVEVIGDVDGEGARVGFASATLPGHPESGVESFVLDRRPDGRVTLTITAVSRPATRLARLAAPVSRAVQAVMTRRYLAALDDVR